MSDAPAPVAITRRDPLRMITLRCDLAAPPLAEALDRATGLGIPDVRRIETGPRGAVAWMSPDELLLMLAPDAVPGACAGIAQGLPGTHHLAVDVSDARAVFRLAGPGARRLCAGGAPVDLDPRAFAPGDFRRTRLGQVAVALWMPEPDVIDLMCFRSVAGFVEIWLASARGAD